MICKLHALCIKGIIPLPLFAWSNSSSSTWSLQWSRLRSHVEHELWSFTEGLQSRPLESSPILGWARSYGTLEAPCWWMWESALKERPTLLDLMRAVGGVCTLGVESSPDMVTVSPGPWKWMFSTSCALGVGGDGGIDIGGGVIASLEDKPFSSIFCFFMRVRL